MKTQKQFFDEIAKVEIGKVIKNLNKETKNMSTAIDSGELIAIASSILTENMVKNMADPSFNKKSEDTKTIIVFQFTYTLFSVVKKAEEAYAKQFNVEKEGK